jgi:hypothetical protein
MNHTVSATWTAPAYDQLDFSAAACPSGAMWLGRVMVAFSKLRIQEDVQIGVTAEYLKALVPANWSDPPTPGGLLLWYTDFLSDMELLRTAPEVNATVKRLWSFPLDECPEQVCQHLDWEGDSDVSGIGMMVTYYMAASFATLYFAVVVSAVVSAFWARRRRGDGRGHGYVSKKTKPMWRVMLGFSESLQTFVQSALIFSAAMLAAAIYRFSAVFRRPEDPVSSYGLLASVFMSSFSIFVCLVLQSVADSLRGHVLEQIFWGIITVEAIAMNVLYRKLDGVFTAAGVVNATETIQESRLRELIWLETCESRDLRDSLDKLLRGGNAILAVNLVWFVYFLVGGFVPQRARESLRKNRCYQLWERTFRTLRIANGFISGIFMWTFLGLFQRYRRTIGDNTGPADKDGAWTFGQVLAIATWVPVVFDLIAIWICEFCALHGQLKDTTDADLDGPESGLGEKLSARYKVIAVEKLEGSEKAKPTKSGSFFEHMDDSSAHHENVHTGQHIPPARHHRIEPRRQDTEANA